MLIWLSYWSIPTAGNRELQHLLRILCIKVGEEHKNITATLTIRSELQKSLAAIYVFSLLPYKLIDGID